MMNIVYLVADSGIPVRGDKGASVHVREMVNAFHRNGHRVLLLCGRLGEGNPLPPATTVCLPDVEIDACIDAGVDAGKDGMSSVNTADADRVRRREAHRIAFDATLCARIDKVLNAQHFTPDVIYERYSLFHKGGAEYAQRHGIYRVLEVNAPLIEEQARYRGLSRRERAEQVETHVFRTADHVIAVSHAMRRHVLSRGVAEQAVSVLPNGVDPSRFHPRVNGTAIRQRYGLEGACVIGFVGSLKPWHGVKQLLSAFAAVRPALTARGRAARVLIVGEGPAMEDLQRQSHALGVSEQVCFTGRVPHAEIPACLAACDFTVAPYYDARAGVNRGVVAQAAQQRPDQILAQTPDQNPDQILAQAGDDGFYFSPMKIVESLAVGRPVIAPALGQIPSLVREGWSGLLYPTTTAQDDIARLGERLMELVSNTALRTRLSANAGAWVADHATWPAIARYITDRVPRTRSYA